MKKIKRPRKRLEIRKLRVRTLANGDLATVVGGDDVKPTSPIECLSLGCTITCNCAAS